MSKGVAVKPRTHRYPSIVAGSKDVGRSVSAISQLLEILTGGRGDGMDRALTPRDLVDIGVLKLDAGTLPGTGVLKPVEPGDKDGGIDKPTAPSNVTAVGGFTAILLSFDTPAYKGHFEAEVWRSSIDVVGSAVMIATTKSRLYSDSVPTGSSYYYWVRFVNRNGDIGPWHGLSGVLGKTSDDIGWLIDKITQETNDSPLVKWLREDVTLINEQTYLNMLDQLVADLTGSGGPLADIWLEINGLNTVKAQLLHRTDLLEQSTASFNQQLADAVALIGTTRAEVQQFYNAVLAVDPETGEVSLQALEGYRVANDARVTQVEQNLSAAQALLTQKVSRTELDGLVGEPFSATATYALNAEVVYNFRLYRCHVPVTVAGAWTGPNNWTLVGNLQGKFTDVYQKLDAANALLAEKVSQVAFDGVGLRLANVEQQISSYTDNNSSVGQMVINLQAELWKDADQAIGNELDKWNTTVNEGRYRVGQAQWNQTMTVRVDGEASKLESAQYQLVQQGNAIASNTEKLTLVTNKEAATAERLELLRTEYDGSAAQLMELYNLSASSDSAFLVSYRQLSAQVADPVTGLAKTKATLDQVVNMTLAPTSALMTQINNAAVTAGNALANSNDILNLRGVYGQSALASRFSSLSSSINSVDARVTNLDEAITGPNGAIATSLAQYKVNYGGTSVTLQQLASATATADGQFSAMWGVKTTVGQLTGGFGLYNNGQKTLFAVQAGTFAILGANSQAVNPFMVVDGKTLIDTAFIKAATIQELVAGSVVADTVKASASITSPVIVGGSITGADLNLLSGGYRMALEPYQNFLMWCGPDGVSKTVGNALFAISNAGQVFAKALTIYDNYGNIVLDSMGNLNGTYIKDLSVDSLKLKGQSVNLKKIASANSVNIPPNGSAVSKATAQLTIDSVVPGTVIDITFEVRFYCEYHDRRMLEFQAGIYDDILGYYLNTFRIKPPFWSQDGKSHILNTVQLTGRAVLEYAASASNVTRKFSVHVWAVGDFYDPAPLGLVTTQHEGWLVVDIGKR